MGLLERISNFIRDIFRPSERDLEDKEEAEGEEISEDIIFQRKILKNSFSSRRGGKVIQVFAVTFEDNFTDRFPELFEEMRKYANDNFLFSREDEYGYDDQQSTLNPSFQFPEIEVGEE